MTYRINTLSYRAGEIVELLETLANAAGGLDEVGEKSLPRLAGNLGGSIDLAAKLASDVFSDMEALIGPAVNVEPEPRQRKGEAA